MQKVEDCANPEVGKFYLVRCAFVGVSPDKWVPVTGTWHEDGEAIGFTAHHFHHDFRFVSTQLWKRWVLKTRLKSTSPLTRVMVNNAEANGREQGSADNGYHIEHRKLRMKRQMPEWPTGLADWQRQLESDFVKKKMTCPHRGQPLTGLPVHGGVVACPGHGLRWNVNTGKLVKVQP